MSVVNSFSPGDAASQINLTMTDSALDYVRKQLGASKDAQGDC